MREEKKNPTKPKWSGMSHDVDRVHTKSATFAMHLYLCGAHLCWNSLKVIKRSPYNYYLAKRDSLTIQRQTDAADGWVHLSIYGCPTSISTHSGRVHGYALGWHMKSKFNWTIPRRKNHFRKYLAMCSQWSTFQAKISSTNRFAHSGFATFAISSITKAAIILISIFKHECDQLFFFFSLFASVAVVFVFISQWHRCFMLNFHHIFSVGRLLCAKWSSNFPRRPNKESFAIRKMAGNIMSPLRPNIFFFSLLRLFLLVHLFGLENFFRLPHLTIARERPLAWLQPASK